MPLRLHGLGIAAPVGGHSGVRASTWVEGKLQLVLGAVSGLWYVYEFEFTFGEQG